MEILSNLWWFIVVLGVLIFFHEFGHFITAKAFGMRVFIFSFGFGRRLAGFKWGDTDCRVSLIPLGGYVKLEGEPDDHLSEDTSRRGDPSDFTSRPRWQRILVYLAGPAANAVLTVAVMTGLYMVGMPDASLREPPVVGTVEPGSPAEAAGLRPGDRIVSIDGEAQQAWEDVHYSVLVRPNAEIPFTVRRDGEEIELVVDSVARVEDKVEVGTVGIHPLVQIGSVVEGSPAAAAGLQPDDAILEIDGEPIRSFGDVLRLVPESGGRELSLTLYRDGAILERSVTPRDEGDGPKIGIASKVVLRRFGFGNAFQEALRWTWDLTKQTFDILGRLITGQISGRAVSGPIGIAQISGDAARTSLHYLALVIAAISLNVGILNLFPLPPLDGGHLAILFGESILRRDFSMTAKIWIMNAGAAALFLLIGLVLYSDLSKTSLLGRFLP